VCLRHLKCNFGPHLTFFAPSFQHHCHLSPGAADVRAGTVSWCATELRGWALPISAIGRALSQFHHFGAQMECASCAIDPNHPMLPVFTSKPRKQTSTSRAQHRSTRVWRFAKRRLGVKSGSLLLHHFMNQTGHCLKSFAVRFAKSPASVRTGSLCASGSSAPAPGTQRRLRALGLRLPPPA